MKVGYTESQILKRQNMLVSQALHLRHLVSNAWDEGMKPTVWESLKRDKWDKKGGTWDRWYSQHVNEWHHQQWTRVTHAYPLGLPYGCNYRHGGVAVSLSHYLDDDYHDRVWRDACVIYHSEWWRKGWGSVRVEFPVLIGMNFCCLFYFDSFSMKEKTFMILWLREDLTALIN